MTTYQVTRPRTGMEALQELKSKFEGVLLGWLGYRAGRNFYEMHPDVGRAVVHGMHSLRRWWVWLFFCKVWLFSACFALFMWYLRLHDNAATDYNDYIINDADHAAVMRRAVIFLIPSFVALLVGYCRNVDYSLFKRRAVYQVMRPLVVAIDKVPNWLLYLLPVAVLCFPF